jgi:hypothetical protein
MTPAKAIAASLNRLAKLTNRELDAEALVFFADVLLQRLTPEEAQRAIHDWAMLSAKFPTPAELIRHVKGDAITARDEATETAAALLATIRRRGYTWQTLYRYEFASLEEAITAECGRIGWLVTQRMGGWKPLCEQFGDDEHASARLRDIAEIAIKAHKRGETNLLGAHTETKPNALVEHIAAQKQLSAAGETRPLKNEVEKNAEADEFFRKMREKLGYEKPHIGDAPPEAKVFTE